jgi:hypothetical protein
MEESTGNPYKRQGMNSLFNTAIFSSKVYGRTCYPNIALLKSILFSLSPLKGRCFKLKQRLSYFAVSNIYKAGSLTWSKY